MKCYYHSDIDAVATCTGCGRAVCQSCAVDVAGKTHCQECLAKGIAAKKQPMGAMSTPTNLMAVTSMLTGLGGWLLWALLLCFNATIGTLVAVATLGLGLLCLLPIAFIPDFLWIAAVVTGHTALRQLERSGENGHGMAKTGLISGYIGLGLTLLGCLAIAIILATGGTVTFIEEILRQLGG